VPTGGGVLRSSCEFRKYTSKLVLCSGANGRLALYGLVFMLPGELSYALCAIGVEVSFPLSSTTWRKA
jgi:hypothetical protein